MRSPHAILLENALLDTTAPLALPIPANLRANPDSGNYIVQAQSELSDSFRQSLARSGAKIVAYIPNNAYLVRLPSSNVSSLAADSEIGAVVPFEPYYKIKSSLLNVALHEQNQFAEPIPVSVLFFKDDQPAALEQIKSESFEIVAQHQSPFGPMAQVLCPAARLTWLAGLSGVQELEPSHSRVSASDLSRARLGAASNSTTSLNYLGLTGTNVLVNVNDLGVDSTHPDLAGRVSVDVPASGVDQNGHGTFVAGLIAGSGLQSMSVSNSPGSPMPPVSRQFRGFAPAASIFSIAVSSESRSPAGDDYLQQTAASRNAFISNNSWHYDNDTEYDIGAAGYDAAVRDALPGVPGSQPLLCVFAAGNAGGGASDGTGGLPDTIRSPGTAKNVITVGAIEHPRHITNQTWSCSTNGGNVNCQTNTPWLLLTDSSNQVASFSSRGNVGLGIEGPTGRFKPDVVAPGTFLVSTRSTTWDQAGYYSSSNNSFNLPKDPNYYQVLSNLNAGLGPFYRFESGTSLAAAQVSGTLALMQEFFERRLSRSNSPALMKALLINGARSLPTGYNLHALGSTNAQGWGIVQLPNSIPASLTNSAANAGSMLLFDQSPSEALATGQQRTRFIALTPNAQSLPLRITLAWTDPPGNPLAGLKLVNDLDLIVTNLQTGEVFWGNDFPAGSNFNSSWHPGSPPNLDMVNNLENVYLSPALGSNYSVTVLARRIAVNAVTEHPNGVVQDYALVISSGDGQLTNALSLSDLPVRSHSTALVTPLTNNFGASNSDFGAMLLHQRVGGNAPLLATNSFSPPGSSNAVISVGSTNQWHFYVFTNNTSFSNAVFLTFQAQPLSLIPAGGDSSVSNSAGIVWAPAADLDLYVSRASGLTNLDPAVLAAADTSLGRDGSESVVYSNATPGVYYIGVKCESMRGAEFGLLADFCPLPFAQVDSMGNELLRGFPAPTVTPSGTPSQPAENFVFFVTPDLLPVRRVIVTNVISYALSDLQVTLTHGSDSVVLNNHSPKGPVSPQTFVYDDSGEGDIKGALPSDGPGSLRQFSDDNGAGQWLMAIVSTNAPATNQNSSLLLERQQDLAGGVGSAILNGVCREDFLSVSSQSTNLTVTATLVSGTGPISLEIYPADASPSNCVSLVIAGASANGQITVDQFSQPPLSPGGYVIRTCNLGPDAVGVTIQANTIQGASPPSPVIYTSGSSTAIPDDALFSSTLNVTNTDPIISLDVGVKIDHPRISDLVLSLLGPDGTRVLLDDGRGGASANGLGGHVIVTNTTPVSFSGGPDAVTNVFDTGETSGTILINYDFFTLPDEMKVYYENQLLFDSGLVSFGGSTNINYGPGASTSFTVVMNEGGNNETNTAWFYSVTSTRVEPLYLTFTENTNLATTPIKFAPVPLTNLTVTSSGPSSVSGIFYLPEETLDLLIGKNPFGQWKLEIWDTRAGATNPQPMLVSWQLALTLANPVPTPVPLSHDVPYTNLLGSGQIQWYDISVPEWVSFSTNSLLSSSAPVNLLFNATSPPTGTNHGDLFLAFGSTAGNWVLRTNAPPGLIPGSHYFLGIQNTNPTTVTLAFVVDFDVGNVITLTSGVPYAGTNSGPLNSTDFYRYVVSTNAVRAQFEINGPTSDMTLLARKGLPLPNLGSHDFVSANPGTNDELIVVYDFSRPVSLGPGEWFLAAINVTGSPAAYSILAAEFAAYGTNIVLSQPVVSTNTICVTWNSLPGVHYFVEGKSDLDNSNWTRLSSTLTATDFTSTFCLPLPSQFLYFRIFEGIVLVPAPPIISSFTYGTNGMLLQWSAPTNLSFTVQWAPWLFPVNWHSISLPATSTNGSFLFLDDGSQTGGLDGSRFYRLRQKP